MTNKYKIVRLTETTVSNAFDKEAELLKHVQSGNLQQALLLWQPGDKTVVLPASKKWLANPELVSQLEQDNWHILPRRTGGAPVPQTSGVINLSHIYRAQSDSKDLIKQGYESLCDVLKHFFSGFNLEAETHATPHSYCDGDYNVNLDGKKIIGTAQRILTTKTQEKIVLVQACILINVNIEKLVQPVNLCNQLNQHEEQIKPEVHTCLQQHCSVLPPTNELYDRLIQSFIHYQRQA